jgi:hypothetical protein
MRAHYVCVYDETWWGTMDKLHILEMHPLKLSDVSNLTIHFYSNNKRNTIFMNSLHFTSLHKTSHNSIVSNFASTKTRESNNTRCFLTQSWMFFDTAFSYSLSHFLFLDTAFSHSPSHFLFYPSHFLTFAFSFSILPFASSSSHIP